MRRFLLSLSLLFATTALLRARTEIAEGIYAEFTTPRGTVLAQLFYDRAPMTCASFIGRAEGTLAPRGGQPFYTGLKWYRVVPDFVIQSGDPVRSAAADPDKLTEAEDAAGHPFDFPDEFVPGLHHDGPGVLSMANAGPDTNSSEFFITLRETNRLNYLHSVFGRVVAGLNVLPKIRPDDPFSIKILRIGAAAKAFKADEASFKALVAQARKYAGPKEPGPAAFFDDPDKVLPQDVPRAKNFNFKLANFERATGQKIYARIFKQFTPTADGPKPGAFNASLARQLGIGARGVVVSYFVDLDTWMIWIGEDGLPVFMGRAGSRSEFVETGALMRRKEAFIDAAKKRASETAARLAAEGHPADEAQKLKLVVDEVLDALILVYEPKS